jgi:hypothetical protein
MNNTQQKLIAHAKRYPALQAEDVFKYIFQSAFGCEHLVSNEEAALAYIKREYEAVSKTAEPYVEPLDGEYSRVYLSCLNEGLTPETLARLFCLSAKKEEGGRAALEQKIEVAKALVASGELPLEGEEFAQKLATWKGFGYPAVHHSNAFREAYKPAYRVIANQYVALLPLFAQIDKLLSHSRAIVALEGGSASGKTTLAAILAAVYGCNVFHMDDFFLRPEQRTNERLSQIGGNIDYERFGEEVLAPLLKNEAVGYKPFDCSMQTFAEPITVSPNRLTVVEGVYSMHPAFGEYYDLSVFLKIDPVNQKERILVRNSPAFAKRFFEEWIPLEDVYFAKTKILERADLVLPIPTPM